MAKLIDITGKALSGEWGTDDEKGIGIPVLRTTNFTNEGVVDYTDVITRIITKKNLDEKYLKPGDIIIEKSGGSDKQPVGRVIYFDGPEKKYLFNNFTGLLRVKEPNRWFPKYVFYSLFGNYRRGGTRPFENKTTGLHNLKTDDYVSRYEVKEAKYSKQIEISEYLDKLYSIIKMREKELVELDTLIKARFVEMFGDSENNTRNWPMFKLSELCDIGSSKRIYQEEQTTDGVPFLRISDLVNKMDTGYANSGLYISHKKYNELIDNNQVPMEGDILVTSRGTLGRCYIISEADEFYFQDGMISWLSKYKKGITPLYIKHLFMTPGLTRQIEGMQAGSTVSYLSIAMLEKLDIMLPDYETQMQFEVFVKQVDKSKFAIQKALAKTQTLFDSLMQEYFG